MRVFNQENRGAEAEAEAALSEKEIVILLSIDFVRKVQR